ncbi:MAG TPA: S8 family serine peptidase [Thermoanaerobaculia bacterium]|nr:S8 family serine peptidase [Thermoanaerobaculia bacterium]
MQIEKQLRQPVLDAEQTVGLPASEIFLPLPATVKRLLGPDTQDYDSFVVAYPPPGQLPGLLEQLKAEGLVYITGPDHMVQLPHRRFDTTDGSLRVDPDFGPQYPAVPIPGLFVVQFAYPIKDLWLTDLSRCGIQPVASLQANSLLLKTKNKEALFSCDPSQFFFWVDSYLSTDRLAPDFLITEYPLGYSFQYTADTDLKKKVAGLPKTVTVDQILQSDEDGEASLRLKASLADLKSLFSNDPDLISVTRRGQAVLSDERQGQIIAGAYNLDGSVTSPGYESWLLSRGLLSATNQQTVAVLDVGYDDGSPPTPGVVDHHPDLENPERLAALNKEPPTLSNAGDDIGHGTMVSGIIVGDGTAGLGTGGKDSQNFLYGLGIAPGAKLAFTKMLGTGLLSPASLSKALNNSRNNVDGSDLALIVNFSSNNSIIDSTGNFFPKPDYDDLASFWDSRVLDANSNLSGAQPMTVVISAGNFAYDYATGTIRGDSVSSGATAKNVISVGATTNYRPTSEVGEPPIDCFPNSNGSRPPNQEALHVSRLGLFSGRGKTFGAYPSSSAVHNTRVKPDLVAPGVRIFSTVPYNYSAYDSKPVGGTVGCQKYFPVPNVNYYTFGTGTSFAAPVVSGVAALGRKWFLDRGTNPSPSLLKAALIATADDIGGVLSNDHRPSPGSGWGRVNLNRLTDSASRFYVTDNLGLAVTTGQQRSWTRTIGNPALDTYIVLAWSDPPSITGNSQVPLVNDLTLSVQRSTGGVFWRGNNFNENITGSDNGYSYPYSFGPPANDSINNVEAIFIPANTFTAGQQIVVSVTGANVPQGPQKFAIYAYNLQ